MYRTVKQRLILFLKYKNIGQSAFEKRVGLSNGYVNNIRQSIQPKTLQKISVQFPELNPGWLLTGEGEMLKSDEINREKEIMDMGSQLFAEQIIKMINNGDIYPAIVVREKEKEIDRLKLLLDKNNIKY